MVRDLNKLLKSKGQKVTSARFFILNIFNKQKKPLSAETICKELSKEPKTKGINEVTVYRTLISFEKAGIIKRVNLRRGSAYFELNDEHHHHIICTSCGNIEDFESRKFEEILKKITEKSPKFKNINEHSLELFGLCARCSYR